MAILLVPPPRQAVIDQQHSTVVERQSATTEYYVGAKTGASWEHLACVLYMCGEGRALNAVKMYLPNEKGMWAWDPDMNHIPWTRALVISRN